MWFKLVFYENLHPIATVIASNGDVYFKASDVGRLLGYANCYNFSTRYAITDFNAMLPMRIRTHGKKCLVFTFDEMMSIIMQKKHKYQTELDVQDMIDLWKNGRVDTAIPRYPILSFRYAPELRINRSNGPNIQDWIRTYRCILDVYFDNLKSFDHCYYEPPPSVITHAPHHDDDDMMIDCAEPQAMDSPTTRTVEHDPRPIERDPRTIDRDPRTVDRDPRTVEPRRENPETILPDVKADSRPTGYGMMADPRTTDMTTDPRTTENRTIKRENPDDVGHDTMTDPRTTDDRASKREFLQSNPVEYSNVPETIQSPEPEEMYNLKMDFDAFPPDQIFISIHNMTYQYVMQRYFK